MVGSDDGNDVLYPGNFRNLQDNILSNHWPKEIVHRRGQILSGVLMGRFDKHIGIHN